MQDNGPTHSIISLAEQKIILIVRTWYFILRMKIIWNQIFKKIYEEKFPTWNQIFKIYGRNSSRNKGYGKRDRSPLEQFSIPEKGQKEKKFTQRNLKLEYNPKEVKCTPMCGRNNTALVHLVLLISSQEELEKSRHWGNSRLEQQSLLIRQPSLYNFSEEEFSTPPWFLNESNNF